LEINRHWMHKLSEIEFNEKKCMEGSDGHIGMCLNFNRRKSENRWEIPRENISGGHENLIL